ncbi:MAG: AbrB/MazE/SpoVT family DNA-binding domain-containing protein [Dehalococcoidia bacterium]
MATEAAPSKAPKDTRTNAFQVQVGRQGRIVIPAEVRQALGIKPGDTLFARLAEGQLVLETRERVIERIRSIFSHVPPGVSLADELIAERRAEAAREEAELAGGGKDG